MAVFVLGKHKKPLMPCSERRARKLLEGGRAVVHSLNPFTIRLKDREDGVLQPIILTFDPGSKRTGAALARETERSRYALWLAEIIHRGEAVRAALLGRAGYRRRRRSKNLRHRAPRFNNRRRPKGWLPPSIESRVGNIETLTRRLRRVCPVTRLGVETASFDTQLLQDPTICGQGYQQGTLFGFQVREYVIETWNWRCAYCGKGGVVLTLDHVVPRSRGGSNRVSNLVAACVGCNQAKGNREVEEFLARKPEVLGRILAQRKAPLRAAAAVSSTRWAIRQRLA